MPSDEEYFKRVQEEYDLNEETKIAVWTAQWFVEMGMMAEEDVIKEFNLTKAQYDKYKELPKS